MDFTVNWLSLFNFICRIRDADKHVYKTTKRYVINLNGETK